MASDKDSLILDSFAGSGTTSHAVLKANAQDGGSRRFILVESEDYADRLTAERVCRAIYARMGTQRKELLREKTTFSQFKKAGEWLARIEAIKPQEGFADADTLSPREGRGVGVRRAEPCGPADTPSPRRGEGLGERGNKRCST